MKSWEEFMEKNGINHMYRAKVYNRDKNMIIGEGYVWEVKDVLDEKVRKYMFYNVKNERVYLMCMDLVILELYAEYFGGEVYSEISYKNMKER